MIFIGEYPPLTIRRLKAIYMHTTWCRTQAVMLLALQYQKLEVTPA